MASRATYVFVRANGRYGNRASVRKMPRKGYPSNPADKIIRRMGLTGPLIDRMRHVMLDGAALMTREDTARTPQHLDPRVEAKYGEAFAAATTACMVGLKDVQIFTTHTDGTPRETPDLLVQSSNYRTVEVEVVNVDETLATRAHLFRTQASLVTALQSRPEVLTRRQLRFTVDYERAKTLALNNFDALALELFAFYESRIVEMLPAGRFRTLFPPGSTAARFGTVVEVDRPTYAILLTFAQADPGVPYDNILSTIERKRRLRYRHAHPLWLVVNVSDPRGPFHIALRKAAEDQGDIAPFERVIIQDGHFIVQIGEST